MNTIKFNEKGNILMVAHRGCSGLERENTNPAFLVAGAKSYYGIETDVHITCDGEIIVFHDDTLTRLLGEDKRIEDCTFEYLRSLRLKDFNGKVQQSLFLPTLEEYLDVCSRYEKVAVLELKNLMQKQYILKIVNIVKAFNMFEKTIFISFAGENLAVLKQEFPNANAQFLFCDATQENLQFMIKHKLDADIYHVALTQEYANLLKQNDIKINCWTVDDLQNANRLKDLGVNFITSNILE